LAHNQDNAPQPGTTEIRRWGKGQRIVGAERQALANDLKVRYAEGASIRKLATSLGRSYGFVHRVLTDAGVSLRPKGGPRRRRTDEKTNRPADGDAIR
jgi:hypothetical protein